MDGQGFSYRTGAGSELYSNFYSCTFEVSGKGLPLWRVQRSEGLPGEMYRVPRGSRRG